MYQPRWTLERMILCSRGIWTSSPDEAKCSKYADEVRHRGLEHSCILGEVPVDQWLGQRVRNRDTALANLVGKKPLDLKLFEVEVVDPQLQFQDGPAAMRLC